MGGNKKAIVLFTWWLWINGNKMNLDIFLDGNWLKKSGDEKMG